MSVKIKVSSSSEVWDRFGLKLFVYVIEAQGLTGSDSSGTSADPIARVIIGKQKGETRAQKKTLNPRWEDLFFFPDPDVPEIRIELVCGKKKKFLGRANITTSLNELAKEEIIDQWYQLEARPGKKRDRVSGKVHVRLFLSDQQESRPPKLEYSVFHEYLGKFKPGDLIVYSGIGLCDSLTQLTTGFPFSRVGLVIESPNKWTRLPELYLVELTRNVDLFLDAATETSRKNSCSVFRLVERLYQVHATSLWWLSLKTELSETQKFKVNEYVWQIHNEPVSVTRDLSIADDRLVRFIQSTFGEKQFRDPMEFVDFYSASFVVELLRRAAVVAPAGNAAHPHDVVNLDCYSKPVLIRPPAGGKRPPSTTHANSIPTLGMTAASSSDAATDADLSNHVVGSELAQTISPYTRALGSQALAGSSAADVLPAKIASPPASPHSSGSSGQSTGPKATFAFAKAGSSQGISATDRVMITPDFRKCPMVKLDKLGTGGFGSVWRCSLEGFTVACKVVKVSPDTDQYDIDALKLEAQILESAIHPNIVRCLGHDFRADEMHLFLEYMPYSLRGVIKNMHPKDNNPHHVRRIAQEIAKGLAYLHAMDPPIIHRDIKAENILLTKDGEGRIDQVKICDFGVSKLCESSDAGAQTYVGTLTFMAPEIRSGKGRKAYTPAVDIYSFGVLLYELITLQPAHKGINRKLFEQLDPVFAPLVELHLIATNENPRKRLSARQISDGLALMYNA
eukprot:CAMPEP_0201547268 /NCGR_PEP_ID=MMETSP0173_2-20130828/3731_1 /ASSEMBLY_ACC=CAM_ASM_000268 /TAXON_ID=218659 /ORGANISM="Vexillifera sp., Strain DIVA3 564/2" /LENGTH=735 /DNA_ID=CAMNT_0047956263 /DNA_START=26 /DNA_END=2233 /DNA_ORIENTATION=+